MPPAGKRQAQQIRIRDVNNKRTRKTSHNASNSNLHASEVPQKKKKLKHRTGSPAPFDTRIGPPDEGTGTGGSKSKVAKDKKGKGKEKQQS